MSTTTIDPNRLRKRTGDFFAGASTVPRIFGILNVTADSFSDGGLYLQTDRAVQHGLDMLEQGAAAIDVGAESTRPGAFEQTAQSEIDLLLPVIRELRRRAPDCFISVDTRKAAVADAALEAGADIINDVSGLQFDSDMPSVIARHGAGVIIIHMRGTPATMQDPENLIYGDLTGEINEFFTKQIALAETAGIDPKCILLDPGIGFSKTAAQNWTLIRDADSFRGHKLPLFYGISRKSFLGKLCGRPVPAERDFATAGALCYLAHRKVDFVRVHRVAETRDALLAYAASEAGGVR